MSGRARIFGDCDKRRRKHGTRRCPRSPVQINDWELDWYSPPLIIGQLMCSVPRHNPNPAAIGRQMCKIIDESSSRSPGFGVTSYIDAPVNLSETERKNDGSLAILARFVRPGKFSMSPMGGAVDSRSERERANPHKEKMRAKWGEIEMYERSVSF